MMRIYARINQNISSMCFLCNAIFLRFPNPAFVADKPLLFTKVLSFPNVELKATRIYDIIKSFNPFFLNNKRITI